MNNKNVDSVIVVIRLFRCLELRPVLSTVYSPLHSSGTECFYGISDLTSQYCHLPEKVSESGISHMFQELAA